MMLYSPHGTQRYHQCEQMTLVLETLFNIAFCSLMLLVVKETQGCPATIKNQCVVVMEAPDTHRRFFFSVIVDASYLFLNTFAQ